MAHLERPLLQQLLGHLAQLQQPQQVRDGRPGPANGLGRAFVGEAELADQSTQGQGFFQRVQVFPLDVLDQGHGDGGRIGNLADQRRHRLQAGHLGRPPAPFAGNDFVARRAARSALDERPDHDRLDHALGPDRVRQVFE